MPQHVRTLLTVALLLFVAASVGTLVVRTIQERSQPADGGESSPTADGLVVYYFHGKVRCENCDNVQAYAAEAVREGFADELRRGTIQWQVVDFDQPQNAHFLADFRLVGTSVVLAEICGGKPVRSRLLAEVWTLVHEKGRMVEYVQAEVRSFREGRP
jgi:hypothetical protein